MYQSSPEPYDDDVQDMNISIHMRAGTVSDYLSSPSFRVSSKNPLNSF